MNADVIIVGGGPTGMMLAAELRLHDIDVLVVERDTEPTRQVRGLGLHIRSVEILDQRGQLDRYLPHGTTYPVARFAGIAKPDPGLDTPHNYLFGIPQTTVERLLTERAVELGAVVRRGATVTTIHQQGDAVRAELDDGTLLDTRWLIGCDGGRSTIRGLAGIDFPGEPPTTEWLLAETELTATPQQQDAARATAGKKALFGPAPHGDPGGYRFVMRLDTPTGRRGATFDEFIDRLRHVTGTDLGAHSPRFVSRFTDATRVADTYRAGHVLLAGDAAHIHPPIGGQGLNLGLQDAVNLGWKLAAHIRGHAPAGLLDTYQAERRPVAVDVLDFTRAQVGLMSDDPALTPLRRLVSDLMDLPGVTRHLTERVVGLAIRYDLGSNTGSDTDLVGRRIRDVDLADGRLYDRLHTARGILLDRTGTLTVHGWKDRVDHIVDVRDDTTALIRPDGYVAWTGTDQTDLDTHLTRWFGNPLP